MHIRVKANGRNFVPERLPYVDRAAIGERDVSAFGFPEPVPKARCWFEPAGADDNNAMHCHAPDLVIAKDRDESQILPIRDIRHD
jgi:hypothetical protein